MNRVMMETTNADPLAQSHPEVAALSFSVSGPYDRTEIEWWIKRCNSEHALSMLSRVLRPLTAEEEALYTAPNEYGSHCMGKEP